MRGDDLEDVVGSEGLCAKTLLHPRQDLGVAVVLGVKGGNERDVLGAQAIQEVLDEHPHAVRVDGLLQAQLARGEHGVELGLGHAVQERHLLGDLVDRLLDRGVLGVEVGGGPQVDTHDGDAVGELLDVLAGAGNPVVVVEVAQGAEHSPGRPRAEGDDQPLLPRALNVEDLDDRASPIDRVLDDLLVDLAGVLGGLGEEHAVADDLEAGLLGVGVGLDELALVDEVAAQRGLGVRVAEHAR